DSNYVYETITLDRGTKGFGFSISGGSNNPHIPGDPSIYVTDILGNHSAALDGRFRINDIIVSVNKANMCNIPHMTAVEILKNAGDTVTFVIKRRRNPNEVSVKLEIIKTNRGYIGGGVGNQHIPGDNGIFVTDIVRDGASYGKLQISDRLIYVNGVNLENVTHDKAVMVLKSTQDRVVMIVGR
ncbi:hypothetical protein HELRODRAFT_141954, partial [Helobdella robusta]|uniref:PDZ domain-containing protein n=1 Tax=Helobdella robusta TaxID=6412 RepID=T1EJ46_HELRO